MEYISSDTNVWLDFEVINRLALPFKLPYTYLMYIEAIEDELLSPPNIGTELIKKGLVPTELTVDEFYMAEKFNAKYAKPSIYDCIALAIAKERNTILLTGDGPLRKAASAEDVQVIGTIGVLDQLLERKCIDEAEFRYCISELMKHNGKEVRLPDKELRKRVEKTVR